MLLKRCTVALSVAAAVALPVSAAIKAMDLTELMGITSDAVHGHIVAKETFQMDRPYEGAVYTRLTIEGASLRTGEKMTTEVVFHGSHDPSDWYTISEMPPVQDTRLGGETVVFFKRDAWRYDKNYVYDLSGLYRVETGFGEPVVIGKGPGFAFAENIKLSVASERIRAVHAQLEALKTPQK